MTFLNPRVHGYIDYVAIVFLFIAPSLFGFSGNPATLFYILAIAYLVMVLLTAYPLGLVKMIPFTTHGTLEIILGAFIFVSPWLFGFSGDTTALTIYVLTGIALFAVWLFTDYRAVERTRIGIGV
jgi:hypothetical protein